MAKKINDLEDVRNTSEDVRSFTRVDGKVQGTESVHQHTSACACGHDHAHEEGKHVPLHTHEKQVKHYHEHEDAPEHEHHHEHGECCGHEHEHHEHHDHDDCCGHDHEHHHEHHHEHGECCGHDHEHDHHHEHTHEHEHHHEDGECCAHNHEHHDHDECCGHDHEHHHEHHHEHGECCGHDHEHDHHREHGDDCCCGHDHEHHHHEEPEHVAVIPAGKGRVYLVENLDCANCGAKIERALNAMPEVEAAVLTFTTKKLRVSAANYDGLLEKMQAVTDSVEDGVVLRAAESMAKSAPQESQGLLATLREQQTLLEIVIGGGIFIITEWLGLVPEAYHMPCLVIAYILLGGRIVLSALKNIIKGKVFDENFLMTVATLGAFAIKAWEEAVGVMFFYRVGEFFEHHAVEKSRTQIMDAVDMRPEVVNLLAGEDVKVIPAAEAQVGDLLLVRVGDRIPLDGVVTEGESLIDTSPVTGEPVPVKKSVGDEIVSGCVNTSGMLKIRVEKVLAESMVTKILDSVENAAANKPAIDRFITRFARVYTPFVVFAAVLTAVIPSLITGDWNKWIYTALTFLVISCPCALVLSVPLAFFSGIGAGSKYGILFKGGAAMEALKNIAVVVMDKTGTVTKGNFVLQKLQPQGGVSEADLLSKCAAAELVSTHPIAVSIVAAAKERGLELARPQNFEEIAGEGLVAKSGANTLLCGNRKLMVRYGVDCVGYVEATSGSEVLVAENGVFLGSLLINDTLKEDAKDAVKALKAQNLVTAMLTGDGQKEANAVAQAAGIDEVRAKLLPQDKLSELKALREKYGAVMFVGDGINDAPVLAGADVGAAMGSGADAAIEAADVVFMNSEMKAIPQAVAIAKATGSIAWQNVIFALAVKAVIMVAGLLGYASMWAAVFADTGVSLLCVLNSIRILYKKVA